MIFLITTFLLTILATAAVCYRYRNVYQAQGKRLRDEEIVNEWEKDGNRLWLRLEYESVRRQAGKYLKEVGK